MAGTETGTGPRQAGVQRFGWVTPEDGDDAVEERGGKGRPGAGQSLLPGGPSWAVRPGYETKIMRG